MKRIQELDALRGIALFGILLVNIFVFHAPLCYYGEFYGSFEGMQLATVDLVVDFAGGKFLFIFAFLFGYGIVLQQRSHSHSFNSYFIKRMMVLLAFGILHLLLFWFGDILATYALLGLLLLPFINSPPARNLFLGILLLFFRPLYYLGAVTFDWPMVPSVKPVELTTFLDTFQHGSFVEVLSLRMKELWAFMPENLVWYLPKTFGLFFIGMYAAQRDFFNRIKINSIKTALISVLLVGVSIVWTWNKTAVFNSVNLELEPLWRPALIGLNVFFETSLGIGYILGFSLIFQNSRFLANVFSKTGRLALTNYILQSLICVLLFYSYGWGLYGQLLPTDLVLISVVIFFFNVVFSVFYLKFKKMGPLESLWRIWMGKI